MTCITGLERCTPVLTEPNRIRLKSKRPSLILLPCICIVSSCVAVFIAPAFSLSGQSIPASKLASSCTVNCAPPSRLRAQSGVRDTSATSRATYMSIAGLVACAGFALASRGASRPARLGQCRRQAQAETVHVDRSDTRAFRKKLMRSDEYFRFGKTQMETAMEQLKQISGSDLMAKLRENGFQLTIGDVTFVLAESYGFCWGVERAVAMAYEAHNYFPEKTIWATNEIIHNPVINKNLTDKGMRFIELREDGTKDFSGVKPGDVVVLPAFGASVDEMALLNERKAIMVDTTCPWVSKVWNSVEKSKDKGCTSIIHGKYDHEETVATKSFATKYIVVKDMAEAEYVAEYILGNGNRDEFMHKFRNAISECFDPDVDLMKVGVANQTTMMKGETELIGKLFERTMIKQYGPQEVDTHFISFNTICDATQERQDAMYKMFNSKYEPPKSKLYDSLEGEQGNAQLQSEKQAIKLSSKSKEEATKGASGASTEAIRPDMCLIVGGYNSSNTTHLLEISEEEGIPGYHIDNDERIGGPTGNVNCIQHKPLSTSPAQAMQEEGLVDTSNFLPDGPLVIGVTSGASTPDSTVGDCLKRILALKGVSA